MYATASQEATLLGILLACQRLYNGALEERISAWRKLRKSISRMDQQKSLTQVRAEDSSFNQIAVTILRSALFRLDRAFQAFFRRVKVGTAPGFPRFRSRDRYDSFSFPNPKIEGNHLHIPSFGPVKLKLYRPFKGTPIEAHVRRTPNGWSVSITCKNIEAPAKVVPTRAKAVGLDAGLTSFAVLSDGTEVENPRFFRKAEETLAERQRRLARKRRDSKSRQRAKKLVAKSHFHIHNQRLDHARKLAKELYQKYDVIAHEDLTIRNMVRNTTLAKSISDTSWGLFFHCLANKAEEAGKWDIGVNPRGTSQKCSRCGELVPKELSEREHRCPHCDLVMGRDHNAAINIEALGWSAVVQAHARKGEGSDAEASIQKKQGLDRPTSGDLL